MLKNLFFYKKDKKKFSINLKINIEVLFLIVTVIPLLLAVFYSSFTAK